MIENVIYDMVCDYIKNEIDYIKREDCTNISQEDIRDLYMLESMTGEEKMKISDNIVWGSDLEEKINELIHYELYEREVN